MKQMKQKKQKKQTREMRTITFRVHVYSEVVFDGDIFNNSFFDCSYCLPKFFRVSVPNVERGTILRSMKTACDTALASVRNSYHSTFRTCTSSYKLRILGGYVEYTTADNRIFSRDFNFIYK